MAVSTDINRSTAGLYLPTEISGAIWQGVQEVSSVAALSSPIDLPGPGLTVDLITGDPVASWTGEGNEVATSRGSMSSKNMKPYSLDVIVPFSNQFRRDKNALYNAMVDRLPGVMAKKIDATVFSGTAPGSDFDVLTGVTAVALDLTGQGAYDALVDMEAALAVGGYPLTGYALSAQGVALLRKVKDGNGLPLLAPLSGLKGDLMGYPVRKSQAVYVNPTDPAKDQIGFAGAFDSAYFGVVEDITVSITDQATITDGGAPLNLWQRKMFAVMVSMEVGFRVKDTAGFRRLTGVATTP